MGRDRYTQQSQTFYRLYMQSPAWRARRARSLKLADYRCEVVGPDGRQCPRTRSLNVHHLTYERLGQERDTDLEVLCWFHHMVAHLLWKACTSCREPCLGDEDVASLWLKATLAQMEFDPDGVIDLRRAPTKEQLMAQIHPVCIRCRGYTVVKPE